MDSLTAQCLRGFVQNRSRFSVSAAGSSEPPRRRSTLMPLPKKKSSSGHAVLSYRLPVRLPHSSVDAAVLAEVDEVTLGSLIEIEGSSKTVRVRFVLQEECYFGQDIFMVGNNPMFGAWDPSKAIPLEWSTGHFWRAELDLPAGEEIMFKFLKRGSLGEIEWQPGPDRSFVSWETDKAIVVSEDWANADRQTITEDEALLLILVEDMKSTESQTAEAQDYETITA